MSTYLAVTVGSFISGLLFMAIVRLVKSRRKKAGVFEPTQEELLRLIAFNATGHSGPLVASMWLSIAGLLLTVLMLVQTQGNMLSLVGLMTGLPMVFQFRFSAKFQWTTAVAVGFADAMVLFNGNPDQYIDAILKDFEYQKAVRRRPKWLQGLFVKIARTRGTNEQD